MELICANKDCAIRFVPKTHNQKYCSSECCKIATNAKIMERYYENKKRKQGIKRKCHSCGAVLSRYNPGKICSSCESERESRNKNSLLTMIMAMSG